MAENDSTTFPQALLNEPPTARLNYFRALTKRHPLLTSSFEELRSAVLDATPGSLLLLFGPTGVGKTTLMERLCESLTVSMISKMEKDKGLIPVVKVQLDAPLPGKFDWKYYFRAFLNEVKEPLIERRINVEQWRVHHLAENDRYVSSQGMRLSVMQALHHRHPMAVFIDDAQHFGAVGSGRKLLDQLNILKSMADKSRVTHVLGGTYELIPFRNLNGQLSRRSTDINFGRYHAEIAQHKAEFINVLYTFQQHLPLKEPPDLTSRWDYFYERSIGCVGVLKDWLTRSLALALKEQTCTLLPKHIERRALSVAQCNSMLREAVAGERELEEEEGARMQLRSALGLKAQEHPTTQKQLTVTSSEESMARKGPRRGSRVGRRKPKRDKIGAKVA